MNFHLRVHHWVVQWLSLGLLASVITLTNILSRSLTRSQEDAILSFSLILWALAGVVCYSFEAIRFQRPAVHGRDLRQRRPNRPNS